MDDENGQALRPRVIHFAKLCRTCLGPGAIPESGGKRAVSHRLLALYTRCVSPGATKPSNGNFRKAIDEYLAKHAREGANVVIGARRQQPGIDAVAEIGRIGEQAIFVSTDVSKAEEIERLVGAAVEKFGRLDYALNNAARTNEVFGPTVDLTEEDFDKTVNVNLRGVWLGMKYQIRQMLNQEPKGGAIVNTSSGNGLGGCPQASFYSATKAAVVALSKSAAWEYAQQGIRINVFVAGAFRTPLLEGR